MASADAADTSVFCPLPGARIGMKTGRQELLVISLCVGMSADAADTSVCATRQR
jgi:hypothetical protein